MTLDQQANIAPESVGITDARVRVVTGDAPGGKSAALNAGVRAARGEVLVFTDTHQRFASNTIPLLSGALADPRVGAVSGALQLPGDRTGRRSPAELYWKYERRLRRDEARLHSAVGVTGAVYAMRRDRWTPIPAGLLLDDLFVPMRLVLDGARVAFEPRAIAVDERRTDPEQEYRRKVRTLTGVIQLCAWMPGVLVPVRNPIWLQFVCHKLLRLLTPYLLVTIVAGSAVLVFGALSGQQRLALLGALTATLAVAAVLPAVRRRARALATWGVTLQAAVVVATIKGIRGRWDVWQR